MSHLISHGWQKLRGSKSLGLYVGAQTVRCCNEEVIARPRPVHVLHNSRRLTHSFRGTTAVRPGDILSCAHRNPFTCLPLCDMVAGIDHWP